VRKLRGLAAARFNAVVDDHSLTPAPLDTVPAVSAKPNRKDYNRMRFLLFLLLLLGPVTARAQNLTVFAAASLTDAMKDIAGHWTKAGHPPLRLSFGASSTLARQIAEGAPAQVYASADEKWMNYLADKGLIAAGTRKDLLGNDLVLVVPSARPRHVVIGPGLDLAELLGPSGRLAMGDPAHVPVGLYAKQALKTLGLWNAVAPRLARTEDVRGALLLVERGEAPAAIVYATDAAISKAVMVAGTFPASSHDPISYPFAVTKAGDTADARALLAFLSGPEARAVFVNHDFKVE
jgi:molybdate transport system substrate-binding protein